MEVFREGGYERASMAEIAARVGGSKATLYGYFASKEELYAAAMLDSAREEAIKLERMLDTSHASIALVLEEFGKSYLYFVNLTGHRSQEAQHLWPGRVLVRRRDAICRGDRNRRWASWRIISPRKCERVCCAHADPDIAALHLQGLLEAGIVEPGLFGVPPRFPIEDAVPCAIRAFMAIYGQSQDTSCSPA